MRRLAEAAAEAEIAWLSNQTDGDSVTGYSPGGWTAEVWVLHAMYENPRLPGTVTHDDVRRELLGLGTVEPDVIGGVNLDDQSTLTGIPLGLVSAPGQGWNRLTWENYLGRSPTHQPAREVPPCFRWFPRGSWPANIQPAPEGSMDSESFAALLRVLAAESPGGGETECVAFYASLPAGGDFDSLHVWRGPLASLAPLVDQYDNTPSNLWAVDRSWLVWTDWDLEGTRGTGSNDLIDRVAADSFLETITWTPPADTIDPPD